jgi:hypothetical protein
MIGQPMFGALSDRLQNRKLFLLVGVRMPAIFGPLSCCRPLQVANPSLACAADGTFAAGRASLPRPNCAPQWAEIRWRSNDARLHGAGSLPRVLLRAPLEWVAGVGPSARTGRTAMAAVMFAVARAVRAGPRISHGGRAWHLDARFRNQRRDGRHSYADRRCRPLVAGPTLAAQQNVSCESRVARPAGLRAPAAAISFGPCVAGCHGKRGDCPRGRCGTARRVRAVPPSCFLHSSAFAWRGHCQGPARNPIPLN